VVIVSFPAMFVKATTFCKVHFLVFLMVSYCI
jgi:hypothetical protein